MSNKKVLLLIGILVLLALGACVLLISLGVFAGVSATKPIADVGKAFMTALKDGDYARAFALCSTDLQTELGDAGQLQALIEDGNAQPASWKFSSRNISDDQGQLEGTVTFTGDRPGTLSIILARVDDEWKVAGFDFQED